MAQRITIVCDLDHGGTDVEATVTERIGYSGKWYEMDVCDTHQGVFAETFASWARLGRRVTGDAGPRARRRQRPVNRQVVTMPDATLSESEQIRQWAKAKGIQVSDSGRIPNSVKAQFREAVPA